MTTASKVTGKPKWYCAYCQNPIPVEFDWESVDDSTPYCSKECAESDRG